MASKKTAAEKWQDYIEAENKQFRKVKVIPLSSFDFDDKLNWYQRNEISKMVKKANQRIDRLEKAGVWSSAKENLNVTRFSSKEIKNYDDFQKLKTFLQAPTATVPGAKKYIAMLEEVHGQPIELLKDKFARAKASLDAMGEWSDEERYKAFSWVAKDEIDAEDVADRLEAERVNTETYGYWDQG